MIVLLNFDWINNFDCHMEDKCIYDIVSIKQDNIITICMNIE